MPKKAEEEVKLPSEETEETENEDQNSALDAKPKKKKKKKVIDFIARNIDAQDGVIDGKEGGEKENSDIVFEGGKKSEKAASEQDEEKKSLLNKDEKSDEDIEIKKEFDKLSVGDEDPAENVAADDDGGNSKLPEFMKRHQKRSN